MCLFKKFHQNNTLQVAPLQPVLRSLNVLNL